MKLHFDITIRGKQVFSIEMTGWELLIIILIITTVRLMWPAVKQKLGA